MIFTSHEPETVLRQAEHVICLQDGSVAFEGAVKTLYENPPDAQVGLFLGPVNWFCVDEAAMFLTHRTPGAAVAIRPEHLTIHVAADSAIEFVATSFVGAYQESIVRHIPSGLTKFVLHRVPDESSQVGHRVAFHGPSQAERIP